MEGLIKSTELKLGDKIEMWLDDSVLPAGGWWNPGTVKIYKGQLCIFEDTFDYGDFSACEPMTLAEYSNDKLRIRE